jgi:hypothetical protein
VHHYHGVWCEPWIREVCRRQGVEEIFVTFPAPYETHVRLFTRDLGPVHPAVCMRAESILDAYRPVTVTLTVET